MNMCVEDYTNKFIGAIYSFDWLEYVGQWYKYIRNTYPVIFM